MSKDTGGPAMSPVTQWFPGDVKPVHVGLYQRKYGVRRLTKCPDYFDGEYWHYCSSDGYVCENQARPWRGLAEEPK